jgi:predicted ATP-grasp superfamily ATP-dependent carboligase
MSKGMRSPKIGVELKSLYKQRPSRRFLQKGRAMLRALHSKFASFSSILFYSQTRLAFYANQMPDAFRIVPRIQDVRMHENILLALAALLVSFCMDPWGIGRAQR